MNTTISISKDTRDILQNFGKKSENYDNIIRRMYNQIMIQEKIQEFVNDSEYSSLEEVEEWIDMKIKATKK